MMDKRRLWAAGAAVLAVTLALSATASARTHKTAAPQVKTGGTLLFGAEQEPPCLNINLNDCNNTWAGYVSEDVMPGVFRIMPDLSYKPYIAKSVKLQLNPMRLTYTIDPKAKWSDGKPITGDDILYTLNVTMDKSIDAKPTGGGYVNRSGYENVIRTGAKKPKVFGPGRKMITLTFAKAYADWKDMFTGAVGVLPAHALQGTDYTKAFINDFKNPKNGKEIASGPWMFKSWSKGSQLVLVRNPNYWGPHKAYLNQLIFRFLTDSNTEIQQVRGGEVDAIYPQPQLPLAELRGQSGLKVISNLGSQYEHIDLQFGPKGNPLTRNPWVRRALMMSLDRNEILQKLFLKLNPKLKPLDNVLYLANSPSYKAHFNSWNYNPSKAAQLLQSHGCAKGGDGIFACNGTRLSFSFESTKGNQLRELAFQVIQARWKANGIEVTNNFKPSNIAFGQDLTAGTWDMFMFAWVLSPDPGASKPIWSCPNKGGTSNFMGYCNAKATALMDKADTILEPDQRAATENAADALIGNDVPSIPLYQKPTFLVFHDNVQGMVDNVTLQGPFYNSEDWWLNK
jgi:peptide/nickel transport system substrate-binding protein